MFEFLKNHPFAVTAYFQSSIVLTFAVAKEELQSFIPECLELDTFENKWAFIAVAMVQTSGLRPKGLPEFLGNDFFLIGYRIFVRYTNNEGKRLRGLYILKSETDKKKMEFLGNIFTHYKYTTTDITQTITPDVTEIKSIKSGFKIVIENSSQEILLPENSPFKDWNEARKFAGPLPFTFSYNPQIRQNWTPEPIKIQSYQIDFIEKLNLKEVRFANAFVIKNIPYQWKKGQVEQWK
jgi:Uncharacterized conserved protein (COG2071)